MGIFKDGGWSRRPNDRGASTPPPSKILDSLTQKEQAKESVSHVADADELNASDGGIGNSELARTADSEIFFGSSFSDAHFGDNNHPASSSMVNFVGDAPANRDSGRTLIGSLENVPTGNLKSQESKSPSTSGLELTGFSQVVSENSSSDTTFEASVDSTGFVSEHCSVPVKEIGSSATTSEESTILRGISLPREFYLDISADDSGFRNSESHLSPMAKTGRYPAITDDTGPRSKPSAEYAAHRANRRKEPPSSNLRHRIALVSALGALGAGLVVSGALPVGRSLDVAMGNSTLPITPHSRAYAEILRKNESDLSAIRKQWAQKGTWDPRALNNACIFSAWSRYLTTHPNEDINLVRPGMLYANFKDVISRYVLTEDKSSTASEKLKTIESTFYELTQSRSYNAEATNIFEVLCSFQTSAPVGNSEASARLFSMISRELPELFLEFRPVYVHVEEHTYFGALNGEQLIILDLSLNGGSLETSLSDVYKRGSIQITDANLEDLAAVTNVIIPAETLVLFATRSPKD